MATKKKKKTTAPVRSDGVADQPEINTVEKKKKADHKKAPMRSSIGRYLNDKGDE